MQDLQVDDHISIFRLHQHLRRGRVVDLERRRAALNEVGDLVDRELAAAVVVERGDERLDLGVRDDARGHIEVVADELLELLGVEVAVARLVVALEQLLQRLPLRGRLELLVCL